MNMKPENMNESEKIICALNTLRLTAQSDTRKKELGELLNKLEIKIGKIPTEI